MSTRNRRPASFLQWYRLGLGVVAVGLGIVMLLRAISPGGSLPLVLMSLLLLAFGAWRIRRGWSLLRLRRVK